MMDPDQAFWGVELNGAHQKDSLLPKVVCDSGNQTKVVTFCRPRKE